MRVGADTGVRVGGGYPVTFLGENNARQMFKIDLVHDAGTRRHDLEIVERRLPPAQKLVALYIALVFDVHVFLEGRRGAERVDNDRVINDEFDRGQGIDAGRVPAKFTHGFAHGGKIHHGGHAGKILKHDARRGKGNFGGGLGVLVPRGQRADIVCGDVGAIFSAQQVFEQYLQAVRKTGHVRPWFPDGIEAVYFVRLAAYIEGAAGSESIGNVHGAISCARQHSTDAMVSSYLITRKLICPQWHSGLSGEWLTWTL